MFCMITSDWTVPGSRHVILFLLVGESAALKNENENDNNNSTGGCGEGHYILQQRQATVVSIDKQQKHPLCLHVCPSFFIFTLV